VTGGNLGSTTNIIRSLGKHGICCYTGDYKQYASGFYSKYCSGSLIYPHPSNEEKYIRSLIAAKKKFNYDLIFGTGDLTFKPIVKYKELLNRNNILVPSPDPDIFFKFCDKFTTYEIAKKNNVPIPYSIEVNDELELLKSIKDIGLPLVIKPKNLSGGRGIIYATNKNIAIINGTKLMKLLKSSVIVQEYIPGFKNVYSVPMIYDSNNKFVTGAVLRKIRELPITGGSATFAEISNKDELLRLSKKLFLHNKWFGIVDPEFKIDPRTNKAVLMEVNPRFFGYSNLLISSGLNLPYILYKICMGEEYSINNIVYDLKFSRIIQDIYSIISEYIHYPDKYNNLVYNIMTYKNHLSYDYFNKSDIMPFFFSIINTIFKNI
jgi:predicted ATP-grasp superfamily ATP-dependent carboligase